MRLGTWEIIAVIVVALLIFGPSKLPALGKSIAEFFKNFKREMKDVEKDTEEIKKHLKS